MRVSAAAMTAAARGVNGDCSSYDIDIDPK
jgi:hypothetical protein